MTFLNIACFIPDYRYPITGVAHWLENIDQQIQNAAENGAHVFCMPEYACEHWLHFAPQNLSLSDEPAWMAEHTQEVIAALSTCAQEHNIAIMAGSYATGQNDKTYNRASFLTATGDIYQQNKNTLTPDERQKDGWMITPADASDHITVFEWNGLRCAMLICLDSEIPALSHKLLQAQVDLLFIPSMTAHHSGFWRVHHCAKARAVELFATVCVLGGTGHATSPATPMSDISHIGGAAVYTPCEKRIIEDGVFHLSGPLQANGDTAQNIGHIVYIKDIPAHKIKTYKQRGVVEVWTQA